MTSTHKHSSNASIVQRVISTDDSLPPLALGLARGGRQSLDRVQCAQSD